MTWSPVLGIHVISTILTLVMLTVDILKLVILYKVVLGGVVVSVLATGSTGFNPGRGRWVFKGS
jgi:hypothetical protein